MQSGAITGFFHVAVTTANIEQSLRFYRDGLGLHVARRAKASSTAREIWALDPDDVDIAFLEVPGGVLIELFEFHGIERHPASSRPCDPASSHFCLYVNEIEALHERMAELGFRSRSGRVVTIADGPLQGCKAVYLIDPDGYHVELFQRANSDA